MISSIKLLQYEIKVLNFSMYSYGVWIALPVSINNKNVFVDVN